MTTDAPAHAPRRRSRRAALRAGTVVLAVAAAVGVAVASPAAPGSGRTPPVASTDPRVPPTTPAASATVRIGFLGRGAGPGSALSAVVEDAERLAVSQFTSDHPALDVIVDDASTGGTAVGSAAAARRLAADGVAAVIGPQSPTEVRAALPVLSADGIPALTATATAPDLSEAGWTSFFRVVADDQQQGADEAEELVGALRVTTLGVVAGSDVTSQTVATWVSSEADQLGATVAVDATITTAASAATAARRVVGQGVGGVFFSGSAPLARTLVTDLAGDGYQGSVLIASDQPAAVLAPLGAAADGVYIASPADDAAAAAAGGGPALVFNDAYHAAFGVEPPTWAAEAYDATDMVLQAVTSGATTGPAVSEYLFNHTLLGVSGDLTFASDGNQVDPPVFVSQIQNGVPVQTVTATAPSG